MKRTSLILGILVLVFGMMVAGCSSSDDGGGGHTWYGRYTGSTGAWINLNSNGTLSHDAKYIGDIGNPSTFTLGTAGTWSGNGYSGEYVEIHMEGEKRGVIVYCPTPVFGSSQNRRYQLSLGTDWTDASNGLYDTMKNMGSGITFNPDPGKSGFNTTGEFGGTK